MTIQKEDFTHYVEAVQQRVQQLQHNVVNGPSAQPDVVVQCLQELQTALEELRTAEEELHQQSEELLLTQQQAELDRRRYADLFEFAPDAYVVTDTFGMVREANRASAMLLGLSQKYLIGKPLANYIVDAQRRAFRALLNQLPAIHRIQEWEVQMQRRDTQVVQVAITVETVRDREGGANGLRWLLRDISTRKQSEQQLRQIQLQNLELIEADRVKSQFIATISHELRTPMNAILGFSELLMRRSQQHGDEQLASMAERIFRNGKHLLGMIEELLDFSKLQAGRLQLHLESFALTPFIQDTVADLRSLVDQKCLTLQVRCPEPDLQVVNDPHRLRQILANLVSNAIKFTDAGTIEVFVQVLPGDRFIILVTDTGIGISPEDQTQIFQEFWQANQTTTRRYGGTGLGLAISKALVDLMQGQITVESEPGQGSIFRVELPHRVPQG
ncbi:MAG: ATP-binding protein [Leptolyngbyaceae cyanobacterium bins.349]|nr:ATP-binding protein [Leptolyngbyaceae cyanobacterium bins.349]